MPYWEKKQMISNEIFSFLNLTLHWLKNEYQMLLRISFAISIEKFNDIDWFLEEPALNLAYSSDCELISIIIFVRGMRFK
jgi:hypothetical protein